MPCELVCSIAAGREDLPLALFADLRFLHKPSEGYNGAMPTVKAPPLERLLEPLARSLTPAAARALVAFRADAETQARIAELADKCNEGQLTPEEREEYEGFVRAIDL